VGANFTFAIVSKDSACNITKATMGVAEPNIWMISYLGNTSANGGYDLDIPNNPTFKVPFSTDVGIPYLSTFNVLSGTTKVPTFRVSKSQTYGINYTNEAVTPPISSNISTWYDLISDRIVRNGKSTLKSGAGNLTVNRVLSGVIGVAAGSKVVYDLIGNLTINPGSFCDIRGIILVSGDLILNPDNKTANSNSACLYVVQGNIIVNKSPTKVPIIPTASAVQPNYDIIEGYFITDGTFQTVTNDNPGAANKYQGLYINGGVIADLVDFHRDLNYSANLTDPGIVIKDDPAYKIVFGADVGSREYSLRELF